MIGANAIALTAVFALGASADAFATETEAREWVARMVTAAKQISFQGSFVYDDGLSLESMRIVHQADGAHERQRLDVLNGQHRGLMRNDDELLVFGEDGEPVRYRGLHQSPIALAQSEDIGRLEESYTFMMAEASRVAGRSCQGLAIQPRDEHRYGYRLWLDRETAMLLQFDLVDAGGRTLERLMFTSVGIGPNPVDASTRGAAEELSPRAKSIATEMLPASEWGWRAKNLPPGFRKVAHARQDPDGDGVEAEHLMYSDGLASVSAYIETAPEELIEGQSSIGPVSTFADVIAGHQVIVVGDVPPSTVHMIGTSLAPVGH